MNLSRRNLPSRTQGFSLIEVLIAVLVLATGMLALAALQGSITRNSVDAKVRSQGLAVAVDVLDRVRAASTVNNNDYQNLAMGTGNWTAWTPPTALGTAPSSATTYESRTTVTRFVRDNDDADCGAGNAPCFRVGANVVADPYRLNNAAEFKRIAVEVRWTDANNDVRTVTVNDLVTSVTRDKSSSVLTQQPTPPVGIGKPVARIPRPDDAGIIPIAVGDGRETAASNPKPVTGRERGRTDETSFQVFTYANEANNVAKLTRVVDTRVLGCRCEFGAQPTSTNAFLKLPKEPTYFDGADYVEPIAGASGTRGRIVSNANQNQDLCVSCCLDHHDLPGQVTKFDPFRNEAAHKHYRDTNEVDFVADFVEATSGAYLEACRFIRVNGVFRVATDARLELMNALESDPNANESIPLASKIPRYQTAVKEFVSQRIVGGSATPDMSAFSDVLIDPATIAMANGGGVRRFLHNRGLYIDYIGPDALSVITEAITECPAGTPDVDCVLPLLPFVSINTTDISQWDTQLGISNIDITNLNTNTPHPTPNGNQAELPTFARGIVTGVATGAENATVFMQRSNTGLSDSKPIDWEDGGKQVAAPHNVIANEVATDAQEFRIQGSPTCPSTPVAVTLVKPDTVTLGNWGLSWGNPAGTAPGCQVPTTGGPCTKAGTSQEASCSLAFNLASRTLLSTSGYNASIPAATTSQWACGSASGDYTPKVCSNLRVSLVTAGLLRSDNLPTPGITITHPAVGTSPGNDNRLSELTNIDISMLAPTTPVTIEFVLEGTSTTGYTCRGRNPTFTDCP